LIHKTPMKVALGAAGLLLASAAVAAAVDAPEAADKGLSTAEEHSGFTVPVGNDGDHPNKDDHPGNPGGAAPGLGDEALDLEAEEGAPEGTHGSEVSAAARDDSTAGRDHGAAVSEVARAGHGAPQVTPAEPVDLPDVGGAGNADEAADDAGLGSDNAGAHRP
jgi:hypothetical protein